MAKSSAGDKILARIDSKSAVCGEKGKTSKGAILAGEAAVAVIRAARGKK